MKKITILVPMHNEEQSLPLLYDALTHTVEKLDTYEWEFLFVDDGSVDSTLEELRKLNQADARVHYLSFSRNFGKEAALLAGIDAFDGDALIPMDADLQHPPEVIPTMIQYWEEGYDDIYARRRDRDRENPARRWASQLFYYLLQHSTNLDVLPNVGDFRLLDKRCVLALRRLQERNRYTKGLFCWIGFRKKEIYFDCRERVTGNSSWGFFSLLRLALNGFLSFSILPLRLATFLGFFVSLFSFLYGLWVIFKTLFWGEPVIGYPTIIVTVLFLGGVQLLSIGIIGEYLGRLFEESKQRPNYIVAEQNGSKV